MSIFQDVFRLTKKVLNPWVPRNLIVSELSGIYGNSVLTEMGEIIKYYDVYQNGVNFPVSAVDYVPSNLRFKKIRSLIDKEARFMFANPIDIKISAVNPEQINDENISKIQSYINEVLKQNHFNSNILKGAKDCFIGKRIAILCNFSEEYGITISFIPSLGFVYENNEYGKLNKIIAFYSLNDAQSANDQRLQKKKYWLQNGYCHVSEGIYDGAGNLVEILIEDETTKFPYIPAVVILNDGLTSDEFGESEVENLFYYEQSYSKLANSDIDAERKSMNPVYWTRDMTTESTSNLSLAPGAFWDLQSDTNARDEATGEVGVLETGLNYSDPISGTLNRIRDTMYEQVDVPNVNTSDLQGVVSSGKTLKAIYWGLIVRCNEKMMAWKYELEMLIKCLIDGAKFYPNIAKPYLNNNSLFNDIEYTINIENSYSLPEDEDEEKATDLAEVAHKTRSIKSYIKKWQGLTDDEADEEIKQIAIEKQILEDAYFPVENPMSESQFNNYKNSNNAEEQQDDNEENE